MAIKKPPSRPRTEAKLKSRQNNKKRVKKFTIKAEKIAKSAGKKTA